MTDHERLAELLRELHGGGLRCCFCGMLSYIGQPEAHEPSCPLKEAKDA